MPIEVLHRYPVVDDQAMADAINRAEDAMETDELPCRPAWEEVLGMAQAANHTEAIGYAYFGLAKCLAIAGGYDEATVRIQEALDAFHRIGDERWIGETWAYAGRIFTDANDPEGAATAFKTALEHARLSGDEHLIGRCLIDNSDLVLEEETYEASIERTLEGIELLSKYDDPDALSRAWEVLARLYADLGEWKAAIQAGERALDYFRNAGDLQHIGRFLTLLGYWSLEAGLYDLAGKRAREAAPLVKRHSSKQMQVELLILQGDLYTRTGRVKDGIVRIDDAERLSREIGFDRDEIIAKVRERQAASRGR